MIWKIVSIKDLAVQAFMRPAFVQATGAAIREFGDAVNDEKHEMFKHPDDYEMYELGEFDDSDGSFAIPKSPGLIAQGKMLKIRS